MTRLNIDIPTQYLNVFNMFKISNKNKIKFIFGDAGQVETFKYILLDYMKHKKLKNYIEILENNDISEINNDISKINNDISEINNDISEINNDISEINNDISEINNDI